MAITTKEYTFTNVTANHTISAEFSNMANVTIKMNAGSPSNCKIMYAVTDTATTPSTGWETINTPTVQGLTITAEHGKYVHVRAIDIGSGYSFGQWAIIDVDAEEQDDVSVNPTSFLISNTTYEAELTLTTTTYTITATAGTGGTITPSGSVSVAYGANQSFTIAANQGYHISRILVDGSPITLE